MQPGLPPRLDSKHALRPLQHSACTTSFVWSGDVCLLHAQQLFTDTSVCAQCRGGNVEQQNRALLAILDWAAKQEVAAEAAAKAVAETMPEALSEAAAKAPQRLCPSGAHDLAQPQQAQHPAMVAPQTGLDTMALSLSPLAGPHSEHQAEPTEALTATSSLASTASAPQAPPPQPSQPAGHTSRPSKWRGLGHLQSSVPQATQPPALRQEGLVELLSAPPAPAEQLAAPARQDSGWSQAGCDMQAVVWGMLHVLQSSPPGHHALAAEAVCR